MPSERIRRRIDLLLDEAVARFDWDLVRDRAQNVLALDPENPDALALVAASQRLPGEIRPGGGAARPCK
ncbi:MAG: hypothetical protein FI717_07985 [SAR202 cluster bacterium]|nr:hypothetical protein [SAR202 cluster bacterium]HCP24006.1 hypothetical protein [Dehalococcoidia bacterium]